MGNARISFSETEYGAGLINSFTVAGITNNPDVVAQTGDLILALEDRILAADDNRSSRPPERTLALQRQLLTVAQMIGYPSIDIAGLRSPKMAITYERYQRFISLASYETLLAAEKLLADEVERDRIARDEKLGTLEDGIRPMGAAV